MFDKLKKALKVAKDLDTLDFTFDPSRISIEGLPYTIVHPSKLYSIWTANGFWFISLYVVGDNSVLGNHAVSKFGAIGKVIVWWKCRRHITNWYKQYKGLPDAEENKLLINKVMGE